MKRKATESTYSSDDNNCEGCSGTSKKGAVMAKDVLGGTAVAESVVDDVVGVDERVQSSPSSSSSSSFVEFDIKATQAAVTTLEGLVKFSNDLKTSA
eukprot:CAMPEP_0113501154 /NCGR_PEP_ID=MMETSP0014_2-20120614/32792_1 /TAXON_ID=2857 /ORGANISM="Nitzschia sp." /LENGTH=96 /DNA_ID=CAMNT_0000395701 /DNA_START=264 /DNA_END=551 /DNA_ORIENTATION=+ /assembly_acc=CAM_ASM_000159